MSKISWWKVPFLVVIAFLVWVVLFAGQFEEYFDNFEYFEKSRRLNELQTNQRTTHSTNQFTFIKANSICDEKIEKYKNYKIFPKNVGCTKKYCFKKNPCCNGCRVVWEVKEMKINIWFPHKFEGCYANNCGFQNCPPNGFSVSKLREKCE